MNEPRERKLRKSTWVDKSKGLIHEEEGVADPRDKADGIDIVGTHVDIPAIGMASNDSAGAVYRLNEVVSVVGELMLVVVGETFSIRLPKGSYLKLSVSGSRS